MMGLHVYAHDTCIRTQHLYTYTLYVHTYTMHVHTLYTGTRGYWIVKTIARLAMLKKVTNVRKAAWPLLRPMVPRKVILSPVGSGWKFMARKYAEISPAVWRTSRPAAGPGATYTFWIGLNLTARVIVEYRPGRETK
jgi:hypothetical protein